MFRAGGMVSGNIRDLSVDFSIKEGTPVVRSRPSIEERYATP